MNTLNLKNKDCSYVYKKKKFAAGQIRITY